jgi:hypothetical protein
MNCQEFNQLIVHLTCDVEMDAAERARALAHADTCLNCGARVTRQQTIATALESLAKQEQIIQAPERIGQLLFAAFEQQQELIVRPVPRPVRSSFWAGLRLDWATAVAAAMILLFAVSALRWWRTPPPVPEASVANAHNDAAATQQPEPAAQEKSATSVQQERASTVTARAIAKPRVRRTATMMRSGAAGDTEFLSLRPGVQSEPTEFEQVVRLQLPRTTLALWGVRLSEDNDNQKVNAEVVFGEDGVARAIRILPNAERSNQ